jgi:hypothetical protein
MDVSNDPLARLEDEFHERLAAMAHQQQAAAFAFAQQRQKDGERSTDPPYQSSPFLSQVGNWFRQQLLRQRKQNVGSNADELLQPLPNGEGVIIVDAEYRVIEDDPKPARTTTSQEVTVWVS